MIYPRLAEENNFVELWFEVIVDDD
jgi:hypothetical protein